MEAYDGGDNSMSVDDSRLVGKRKRGVSNVNQDVNHETMEREEKALTRFDFPVGFSALLSFLDPGLRVECEGRPEDLFRRRFQSQLNRSPSHRSLVPGLNQESSGFVSIKYIGRR